MIADHHDMIHAALAKLGGATIHELAAETGLDHVQVARRLSEEKCQARVTAETRPGLNSRPCRVWKAK